MTSVALYPTRRDGGPDTRGSARDRRARKQWLLDMFGNGRKTRCYLCRKWLWFDTLTVDRKHPGALGGRYTRDNIRPACGHCNSVTGCELQQQLRKGDA